jgi:hypothetical protein
MICLVCPAGVRTIQKGARSPSGGEGRTLADGVEWRAYLGAGEAGGTDWRRRLLLCEGGVSYGGGELKLGLLIFPISITDFKLSHPLKKTQGLVFTYCGFLFRACLSC